MTCSLCKNPKRARGLCSNHYEQWRRYGRQLEAMHRQVREAAHSQQEQDRIDFYNAFQGAQKALTRLKSRYPDIDYTSAEKLLQEKIAEYKPAGNNFHERMAKDDTAISDLGRTNNLG